MWAAVGLERDAETLRAAAATLVEWEADGTTVAALEERNLLNLARIVTHAALVREVSRGAHDRTDFPESREVWRHSLAWRREDAVVTLEVPA